MSEHTFMLYFHPHERGCIGELFHRAVRGGAADPVAVLRQVRRTMKDMLASPVTLGVQRDRLKRLGAALEADSDAAAVFAEHAIRWNRMPEAERRRLKSERGAQARVDHMAELSATEKQIEYLSALGCSGIPKSRLEASRLIDLHRRQREAQ